MPLWMCGKIQLDDWILITEDQHTQIRRLADSVWRDFRDQCKIIAVLKHTTILMAMVSMSPNHICWDLILGISKEIAEMLHGEMAMVVGVGAFMFGLKQLEMWRTAVFYFMVGTHRGSRSLAIRILQPIVHAHTMEAVAHKEACCIGGSTRHLLPQGSLTGTDVNMAVAQQQPSTEEPLLMFPPHMPLAQQHCLPISLPEAGQRQGRGANRRASAEVHAGRRLVCVAADYHPSANGGTANCDVAGGADRSRRAQPT